MARAAATAQRDLVEVGPARHGGGAHVLLPGQVRQGPSAADVLLEQPGAVDDALALVVPRAFVQGDAVFGGQPRQGLPGEPGLLRDVVERLILAGVALAELLLGERRYRSGTGPGQCGGAASGLGQGLVAAAVYLADQAALGQADADKEQGDGKLVGDVLEVVADLGRAAVPRAQEVQVIDYKDAYFA